MKRDAGAVSSLGLNRYKLVDAVKAYPVSENTAPAR